MRSQTPFPGAQAASGFPSPALDHAERGLDLHRHLVRNPASTYFLRVRGDGMAGAGIAGGDLLVVDRAAAPRPGSVVVAALDGELVVRRLLRRGRALFLVQDPPAGAPVPLDAEREADVWGVAVHVIRNLTPCTSRGAPCASR
uniref:Translesion error-prone DNA polymerase V autoproteolytic subunit n=1 Tax=Fundidesulfovibrio putealis TaxID=270496 RepID=A0A7C4AH42_9BACT